MDNKQYGLVPSHFSSHCCFVQDPCRPGVREAVERCQRAGVKVESL